MDLEIPGYDIIERIGSGGMASVYRASQNTFQRDVALKVLRQDLGSDEKYSERFVQESQIIAKLHHSHIVQVYDVGQFKNLFYVAMEFLSGRNLSEMLRQQRVDRNRAVRIFSQIASALDYSHQKGIVHRDVKPDNIMFRDDGAAVLTDFGIAKDTDATMELTQTGTIMGTPKYMSPEQIRGGTVSPSSDLYSLGVVFFQMLTGKVPYGGSTLVEVAVKHLNEPIPILDDQLSQFQPIIDKILAKKPEDRYIRGKDILSDLAKAEHRAINVLLDTDDEEELLHDTGSLKAPIVKEEDLAKQDTFDNTVTNHDGVTLLSLEGLDPGIDATTIRPASPVTGKYRTPYTETKIIPPKPDPREATHAAAKLSDEPVPRVPARNEASDGDTAVAEKPVAKVAPKPVAPAAKAEPSKPSTTKPNTAAPKAAQPKPKAAPKAAQAKAGTDDPLDTTNWEYLLDQPEPESTATEDEPKGKWGLYSGIAIAVAVVVVLVTWLSPSMGPSEIPELDARRTNPALAQPTIEPAQQPANPAPQPQPQEQQTASTIKDPMVSSRNQVGNEQVANNPLDNSVLDDSSAVVENSVVEGTVLKEPEVTGTTTAQPGTAGPATTQTAAAEPAIAPAPSAEEILAQEQAETIAQLLAAARRDERSARLTKPLGNNALVKYREVLTLEPDNMDARLGISRIADHFVANAEQFPSKENMGLAYSVLSDAKSASPGNPYLVSIDKRLKVVTDTTKNSANQADTLYKKLQVQGLLRSAEIDEREGRLILPAHNNAADKYRKVLDIDPSNKTAAERLASIEQTQP